MWLSKSAVSSTELAVTDSCSNSYHGGSGRSVVSPAERAEFELGWKAAGVTCIFQNAGEEGQDPLRLRRFTYLTDRLRDFASKAVTPDDIEAAKRAGRHCLYFSGPPRRVRYESLWPEGSMNQRLPGAKSLVWTNWPLFTV